MMIGHRFMAEFAALALLAAAPFAGTAWADDAGHCSFTQKGNYGAFKVCEVPVNYAKCTELGTTGDNSDPVHAAGACPTEELVGTCDKGATKLMYYNGDPGGLEVGCGFQGGTWVKP